MSFQGAVVESDGLASLPESNENTGRTALNRNGTEPGIRGYSTSFSGVTVELVHAESVYVRDGLAGLLIGGSLGVFLNAYSPVRDGAWLQLARALAWGVPAAALGGALGLMAGEVVIGLFRGGLLGRALSWSVLGLGIGLGQGLADRSRERLVYGLIGGGLGGFIGGFLFEWLRVALGDRHDVSQAVGITILGAGLGMCLALVEQCVPLKCSTRLTGGGRRSRGRISNRRGS